MRSSCFTLPRPACLAYGERGPAMARLRRGGSPLPFRACAGYWHWLDLHVRPGQHGTCEQSAHLVGMHLLQPLNICAQEKGFVSTQLCDAMHQPVFPFVQVMWL